MPNAGAKVGKSGLVRGKKGRPVSCYLCRLRKLRCSREHPCSNCNTRGVKCSLYGADDDSPVPASASSAPSQASPVVETRNADASLLSHILERLQRLEDALSTQATPLQNPELSCSRPHTCEWQTNTSSVPPSPRQLAQQPIDHRLSVDVKRLEQVSTSHPSKVSSQPIHGPRYDG